MACLRGGNRAVSDVFAPREPFFDFGGGCDDACWALAERYRGPARGPDAVGPLRGRRSRRPGHWYQPACRGDRQSPRASTRMLSRGWAREIDVMVDDVLTGRRQWAAVVTMASMVFCVGLGTQQAPRRLGLTTRPLGQWQGNTKSRARGRQRGGCRGGSWRNAADDAAEVRWRCARESPGQDGRPQRPGGSFHRLSRLGAAQSSLGRRGFGCCAMLCWRCLCLPNSSFFSARTAVPARVPPRSIRFPPQIPPSRVPRRPSLTLTPAHPPPPAHPPTLADRPRPGLSLPTQTSPPTNLTEDLPGGAGCFLREKKKIYYTYLLNSKLPPSFKYVALPCLIV